MSSENLTKTENKKKGVFDVKIDNLDSILLKQERLINNISNKLLALTGETVPLKERPLQNKDHNINNKLEYIINCLDQNSDCLAVISEILTVFVDE